MMISRRLLRIKIVQILYAHLTTENTSVEKSEKELQTSIIKAYDLYHLILMLIVKLGDYAEERIELAKNKILPTIDDLHPNTQFVDNLIVAQLRNCSALSKYISASHISWQPYPEIIKSLYLKIIESPYYKSYLDEEKPGYESDKKLIINILKNELEGWELLYQMLEEQSIYWNDDIEFVIGMILKTIEKFKPEDLDPLLMALYKNDDDREFGKILLRKTLLNHEQYREMIDHYTQNWEIDRIATMDVIIMEIAISELIEFPSIPIKVTLNEYIDIARFYSTPKSNEFVNGVLDRIVIDLKKENKIIKTGRGLLGEAAESEY
jgi:N utilization substance protein B